MKQWLNTVAVLASAMAGAAKAQSSPSLDPSVRFPAADQSTSDIVVTGRAKNLIGIAASSSEGEIGKTDLENRPIQRIAELLEVIPGFIATQHSGGGKANQYFLRGFNLDTVLTSHNSSMGCRSTCGPMRMGRVSPTSILSSPSLSILLIMGRVRTAPTGQVRRTRPTSL